MNSYRELLKPRIAVMVMATTALGYFLAGGRADARLAETLLGATLASCACACLNQVLEISQDSLMRRTRIRPLPMKTLTPSHAIALGSILAAAGLGLLTLVGPLAVFLTALTIALYLLAYTPLKRVTPQATWFGCAAGALPPVIGWAAAQGRLTPQAWILFAIQFIWQVPHFLALFWLHRDDYARAGFRVMPVVDPAGRATAVQIAIHSFTLLLASLLPVLFGMAGLWYAVAAFLIGAAYMALGLRASWTLAVVDTRRLFLASLAYLPIIFGMLLIGGA